MSPAAAATALRAGSADSMSADELIARMASENAGSEEFAQYRHDPRYPRYPRRRPRRRRICRRERTRWGWRTVCRWAYWS